MLEMHLDVLQSSSTSCLLSTSNCRHNVTSHLALPLLGHAGQEGLPSPGLEECFPSNPAEVESKLPGILAWFPTVVMKTSCPKVTWRRKGFIWLTGFNPFLRDAKAETRRWELRQRLWRRAAYCLLLHGLLSPLSYTHPGLCPLWTEPFISVINQENAFHTGRSEEYIFQLRFPDDSELCHVD